MLKPILCACGCLQPMFAGDEWRDGMLRNHGASRRVPNTPSYLVIDMGYKTPCWAWQGVLNKWGYAKIKRNGITDGGHRLFYRAYIGSLAGSKAGSDGLDHLCRIRKCVNPEHVEPVTCTENIRRGKVAKLFPHQVESIRIRALAGENQTAIARCFGVQQSQVSRIKCGVRWSAASIKA